MSSRAQEKAEAKEARLAAERAADQAAARKKRLVTLGGVLAAAAVIVVVAVLISQGGTEDPVSEEDRAALLDGIPQSGTKLGADTAPVVVEEYADLQCPFCAQFASTNLPPIVNDYVKPGDVQLDLKLVSILGPDSETGARFAAGVAEQDRLWQFTEAFYANQGEEGSGYITEEFLREIAGKSGVDADKALAAQDGEAATKLVDDSQQAFEDAKLGGTPSFRVGPRGGEMKTVASPNELPQAIADALEQAGAGS